MSLGTEGVLWVFLSRWSGSHCISGVREDACLENLTVITSPLRVVEGPFPSDNAQKAAEHYSR